MYILALNKAYAKRRSLLNYFFVHLGFPWNWLGLMVGYLENLRKRKLTTCVGIEWGQIANWHFPAASSNKSTNLIAELVTSNCLVKDYSSGYSFRLIKDRNLKWNEKWARQFLGLLWKLLTTSTDNVKFLAKLRCC